MLLNSKYNSSINYVHVFYKIIHNFHLIYYTKKHYKLDYL